MMKNSFYAYISSFILLIHTTIIIDIIIVNDFLTHHQITQDEGQLQGQSSSLTQWLTHHSIHTQPSPYLLVQPTNPTNSIEE